MRLDGATWPILLLRPSPKLGAGHWVGGLECRYCRVALHFRPKTPPLSSAQRGLLAVIAHRTACQRCDLEWMVDDLRREAAS